MARNFFNPEGLVWKPLGALGDLVMLSLLWGLCSIPLVTIGPATAAALGVTASDLLRPETARGTASAVMSVPLRATVAPHDVIGSVAIPTTPPVPA